MKLREFLRKAKDILFDAIPGVNDDNVQDAISTVYDHSQQALSVANGKIDQPTADARYLGISDTATNSQLLDNKDSTEFVLTLNISDSVTSSSITNVSNSLATKTAYDKGIEALTAANSKLNQATADTRYLGISATATNSQLLDNKDSTEFVLTLNISNSVTSGSTTNVASSLAVKTAYDQANTALSDISIKDTQYNSTFEKLVNRNKNNGYAGLDSAGLLSPNQIPSATIVNVESYDSIEDRNADTGLNMGDMAIIDNGGSGSLYILKNEPNGQPTTNADWLALQTNVTVDVNSWNSRNGNVMPALGDYDTTLVLHNESTLDGYLDALQASIPSNAGDLDAYNKSESDGRFVNESAISDSVTSTSTTNVSSSAATKSAYDRASTALTTANGKIDQPTADSRYLGITAKAADSDKLDGYQASEFILTTQISSSTSSTSSTNVSSSAATKSAYDRASTALTTANGKIDQPTADSRYLGITAKAADSENLDGYGSSHFLSTTGKAADSDKLDGQHGSYYRNASNLNDGTVPNSQLPSTALRTDNAIKDIAGQLDGGTQTRISVDYNTANKVFDFNVPVQSDNNFTNTYKNKLDNLLNNQWTVISASKTLVSGNRVIVDMAAIGEVVMSLPRTPIAGDTVMIADGSGFAGKGKTITIDRNGNNIMSLEENMNFNIPGYLATFVYMTSTRGWVVMN